MKNALVDMITAEAMESLDAQADTTNDENLVLMVERGAVEVTK